MMTPKKLILLLVTSVLFCGCSLPFGISPNMQQTYNPTGNPAQAQADVQESFPVAPDSRMASPDTYDPNNPGGSFTIPSQSSLETAVKFYANELPRQGWTLRYTDANFTGGQTQYWKKDTIFLSMDFGYGAGRVTIRGLYDRVEARFAQKLPRDFPLPGRFEMVKAEETSWELYIPQDYAVVTNWYTQKLSSLNWKEASTPEPILGSCGGTDCGENATFPPGAMPTATMDPRRSNELSYSMPDGNIIDLTITPNQNRTILDIVLLLKNLASAGLPQDVPIYPGALVQIITPGSAEFQISTDMQTVENYYEQHLTAAGWLANGTPNEASGNYLQNWKKGDQAISITLVPSGANTALVIECPTCNP
ncbi:MAG: hypothetical protein ABSA01_16925 [Anaerolineales bacterium]